MSNRTAEEEAERLAKAEEKAKKQAEKEYREASIQKDPNVLAAAAKEQAMRKAKEASTIALNEAAIAAIEGKDSEAKGGEAKKAG